MWSAERKYRAILSIVKDFDITNIVSQKVAEHVNTTLVDCSSCEVASKNVTSCESMYDIRVGQQCMRPDDSCNKSKWNLVRNSVFDGEIQRLCNVIKAPLWQASEIAKKSLVYIKLALSLMVILMQSLADQVALVNTACLIISLLMLPLLNVYLSNTVREVQEPRSALVTNIIKEIAYEVPKKLLTDKVLSTMGTHIERIKSKDVTQQLQLKNITREKISTALQSLKAVKESDLDLDDKTKRVMQVAETTLALTSIDENNIEEWVSTGVDTVMEALIVHPTVVGAVTMSTRVAVKAPNNVEENIKRAFEISSLEKEETDAILQHMRTALKDDNVDLSTFSRM
tara:strand:+ start:3688 stop:4713 length:1026 start_codon:yes stop_codon:yes gene_type:complete